MLYISKFASMIYRASQAYFDETLAPYHIGCGQQFFLMHIHKQPGIGQWELAVKGHFDKGTCARAVSKLEELGYLKREVCSNDRRSVQLFLTPLGESLVPVIEKMLEDWNTILCMRMDQSDAEQARILLERIAENAMMYRKHEKGV